jgi:hypothetical protein
METVKRDYKQPARNVPARPQCSLALGLLISR